MFDCTVRRPVGMRGRRKRPLAALFAQNEATIAVEDSNDSAQVVFDGNTITAPGVSASSLTAGNFLLAPGEDVRLHIDQMHPLT